jgi:membrane-bound ClpP family serine protease
MTEDSQSSDHRIRQTDVSRLPFTAGIVLGVSGLLTLVLGLYTFSTWRGWLFVGVGIIVAVTGVLLLFKVSWAHVAAIAAASVSLVISAIWVAKYPWFSIPTIGFDVVAIYSIVREIRLSGGRNPLRT